MNTYVRYHMELFIILAVIFSSLGLRTSDRRRIPFRHPPFLCLGHSIQASFPLRYGPECADMLSSLFIVSVPGYVL